jgi:hypothetical protein
MIYYGASKLLRGSKHSLRSSLSTYDRVYEDISGNTQSEEYSFKAQSIYLCI